MTFSLSDKLDSPDFDSDSHRFLSDFDSHEAMIDLVESAVPRRRVVNTKGMPQTQYPFPAGVIGGADATFTTECGCGG